MIRKSTINLKFANDGKLEKVKEIAEEYRKIVDKNTWFTPGIYAIINNKTGDIYIGSAASGIGHRFSVHKYLLKKNKHSNPKMQNSWNKYGGDAFVFIPMEVVRPDKCLIIEQEWMNRLKPKFNLLPVSESRLGSKHTKEARLKMSKALKGKSSWNKGLKTPEEVKTKISIANTGRFVSRTTREKLSKGKIGIKNHRSKQVKCIELDKTFESVRMAAKFIKKHFGIHAASHGNIASCCRGGRHKTAYRFKWKYV